MAKAVQSGPLVQQPSTRSLYCLMLHRLDFCHQGPKQPTLLSVPLWYSHLYYCPEKNAVCKQQLIRWSTSFMKGTVRLRERSFNLCRAVFTQGWDGNLWKIDIRWYPTPLAKWLDHVLRTLSLVTALIGIMSFTRWKVIASVILSAVGNLSHTMQHWRFIALDTVQVWLCTVTQSFVVLILISRVA